MPCVVHRSNPTDINLGLSSSYSLRKGEVGIGTVVMEPLKEVWGDSLLRVNNTMDKNLQPFTGTEGKSIKQSCKSLNLTSLIEVEVVKVSV